MDYYGQDQVLWVDEGIVGDDTDGHIDDTVRFINEDTVITVIEENKQDENYQLLQHNLKQLHHVRGTEKMHPDHILWPFSEAGDAIKIKR